MDQHQDTVIKEEILDKRLKVIIVVFSSLIALTLINLDLIMTDGEVFGLLPDSQDYTALAPTTDPDSLITLEDITQYVATR